MTMFENTKSEDYMGMISWSRTCGSARALFGTEIETANPITLERLFEMYAEHEKIMAAYEFYNWKMGFTEEKKNF